MISSVEIYRYPLACISIANGISNKMIEQPQIGKLFQYNNFFPGYN